MSNRCVKFVPALFATVLAGANLTTGTDLRAQTSQAGDDNCLSAPKGAMPSGGHWYYRIDRATKRQCWYLRDEGERTAPAQSLDSPATPPAATADTAPQQQPLMVTSKSIADARAEWVSQQKRAERNSTANAAPQITGTVSASTVQNSNAAAAPNVLAPTPISATRWSDMPGTGSSTPANLQTAAADAPAADQTQDAAEQMQQPAAAAVAAVAADPAPAKPTASLQMLLLVMAAALALAGITVSLIFRVGRIRARRAMRRKRRAMWDSVQKKTKRRAPQPSPQPMFHDEEARLRRSGAVHHTRVPQERPRVPQERPYAPQERARAPQERVRVPQERARAPQEREQQVTEMLARLARSAQT